MNSRFLTANSTHQRERTLLFLTPPPLRPRLETPDKILSPYDPQPAKLAKQNEAFLSLLESQNDEEVDLMSQKVAALKLLGMRMGTEINKLIQLNDDLTNSFERGKTTLKNTYNRMVVMSQRAGILWKMWLAFFAMVFLWCFYVWLF